MGYPFVLRTPSPTGVQVPGVRRVYADGAAAEGGTVRIAYRRKPVRSRARATMALDGALRCTRRWWSRFRARQRRAITTALQQCFWRSVSTTPQSPRPYGQKCSLFW